MKIFSACFHPNGFFIDADTQEDFWVLLSTSLGWGKFTLVRVSTEFSLTGGLFELTELRPELPLEPSLLVHSSNVLWRLPEALEVLKRYSTSQVQVGWIEQ